MGDKRIEVHFSPEQCVLLIFRENDQRIVAVLISSISNSLAPSICERHPVTSGKGLTFRKRPLIFTKDLHVLSFANDTV